MMKSFLYLLIGLFCIFNCEAKPKTKAKTRKAVFIVLDGIPADMIERIKPPTIYHIASKGAYGRAYTGGEAGNYSETPTISAIGYTNLLTATWMNKHNVNGNSDLHPNYNYWTIFRIAKEQPNTVRTALYSSWTDNRTVLLGENKPETNNLQIDYVKDGYDLDTNRYPHKEKDLHIFDIDERVSVEAADGIRTYAPDLTWVYLWYTDDAAHIEGNGDYFDEYTRKADQQVARIWNAVKYREANCNEEWMVVVTTDHGRDNTGFGHGGQSERERTTWISTNVPVNHHFNSPYLSITDITPSICRFMDFQVPQDVRWEQDGQPFIGDTDIYNLNVKDEGDKYRLTWNSYSGGLATIYVATSNAFSRGGKDGYRRLDKIMAGTGVFEVEKSKLPHSKIYKFVVTTPYTQLNKWIQY